MIFLHAFGSSQSSFCRSSQGPSSTSSKSRCSIGDMTNLKIEENHCGATWCLYVLVASSILHKLSFFSILFCSDGVLNRISGARRGTTLWCSSKTDSASPPTLSEALGFQSGVYQSVFSVFRVYPHVYTCIHSVGHSTCFLIIFHWSCSKS